MLPGTVFDDEKLSPASTGVSDVETIKPYANLAGTGILMSQTSTSVSETDGSRSASPMSPSDSSETCESSFWRAVSDATTRSDLELWSQPEETLIIFDWDDTLCPTTHFMHKPPTPADDAALMLHAQAVEHVLKVASTLGRMEIVSMAGNGWIEDTLEELMPSVAHTMKALNIPVSLSREFVPRRRMREAFSDDRSASHHLKRRTMMKVLRDFYTSRISRRTSEKKAKKGRSWKNVLSIGDSEAERFALQDVVMGRVQRDRNGRSQECRCKTLKLLSAPTLTELTQQLRILAEELPLAVRHDGDLQVDFDETDGNFSWS